MIKNLIILVLLILVIALATGHLEGVETWIRDLLSSTHGAMENAAPTAEPSEVPTQGQ